MSAQHRAVIPRNTHDPSIQDGLGIPEAARGRDGGNGERDPRRRKMEMEREGEQERRGKIVEGGNWKLKRSRDKQIRD